MLATQSGPPEFANAMGDFLKECFARAGRPNIIQRLMSGANAKYDHDVAVMRSIANKSKVDHSFTRRKWDAEENHF
jgi:hypothetical protein